MSHSAQAQTFGSLNNRPKEKPQTHTNNKQQQKNATPTTYLSF
jgi:hypothetical protein